jgi:hypothetical protein
MESAFPKSKKARIIPSARKIMGTVFWDAERRILVGFLRRKETVIVVRYVETCTSRQVPVEDTHHSSHCSSDIREG